MPDMRGWALCPLPFWRDAIMENTEYYCDTCEEGKKNSCPHAQGRHYDAWGEGISPPDYCPNQQTEDLQF